MSWIKGTSSDYIDLSNDIVLAVTSTSADSVDSVVGGGSSGYAIGDLVTLTGGTFTTATVLEVTAVSTGVITAVRIDNAGIYSVAPGDPVSQGSTDGAGVGTPTFNMTYSTNGWTTDRDLAWSGSDREVIMHGTGAGSDSIYVGWRTYNVSGSGRFNWEMHGMTGFDDGVPSGDLTIVQQPGISPGNHLAGTGDSDPLKRSAYLPLQNSSMNWWVSVTPSRIILSVKVASNYYHAYLGFINRYATSTEYPYPLLVAGSASEFDVTHNQVSLISTLTDPWSEVAASGGPMYLLDASGTWNSISNAIFTGADINPTGTYITLPCGTLTDISGVPLEDRFNPGTQLYGFNSIVNYEDIGAPIANLEPTPGTGNDFYVLFPTMLLHSNTLASQQVYGEIDDVFWFQAFGGVATEDRIIQTDVYRVFRNCNRSGIHSFLAIKES